MNRCLSWAAILMLGTVGCTIEGPPEAELLDDERAIDEPDGAEGVDELDGDGGSWPAEPPPDDPSPDDPGAGGSGGGSGGGGQSSPQADFTTQVCYPGDDGSGDTCLPIVPFGASFPAAYDYPGSSQLAYQPPVRFIDLEAVSSSNLLAPNFALGELMQAHKGRYALFQPHVVSTLQAMRDETGGALLVHSAYRNPGYNAGVGGATYSRHMYGDGVDMHSAVVSLSSMKSRCQAHGADYVSVYATHVHCDWRYAGNHPSFFGMSAMQVGEPSAATRDEATVARQADGAWTADVEGFDEGEPYREWTSFDARGHRIETRAGASYRPPASAVAVEVMVGGRVALRVDPARPGDAMRLPDHQVRLRLDTLSAEPAAPHQHD